jgi:hypothetical protein
LSTLRSLGVHPLVAVITAGVDAASTNINIYPPDIRINAFYPPDLHGQYGTTTAARSRGPPRRSRRRQQEAQRLDARVQSIGRG